MQKTLKPLSREAIQKRTPLYPEELVGATHDPIHKEINKSRPTKSVKRRKKK